MAKAPKPGGAGTTGGNEKVEAARASLIVTVRNPDHPDEAKREVTRRLYPGAISVKEHALIRKISGASLSSWITEFDDVSLKVLWWAAARQEGDLFTTVEKAVEDWPSPLTDDLVDIEQDDGLDTDGEGDDPQS